MSDNGSKILVFLITLSCCAFGAYLAIYLPSYVNNSEYLGGLIFLQIVAAALWNYRQRFFPVLLLVFLVAGILTPLAGAATVGRWFILAAGAIAGFVAYMADPSHRFGTFHLLAALCVVAAFISAMVSAHPVLAALKALSILLLFLYGAAGARLAIVGREAQFLRGCLVTCEILVYVNAVLHFIFHISLFNNPNSLGALTGVALLPRFITHDRSERQTSSIKSELSALRSGRLWLTLAASAATTGSVLSTYSYISPLLTQRAGLADTLVPLALAGFGAGALAGSILGGRLGDRRPYVVTIGAAAAITAILLALCLFSARAVPAVIFTMLLGLVGMTANPVLIALAVRFGGNAPTLASALSTSAFNLGTAMGSWAAGLALESSLGAVGPVAVGAVIGAVMVIPLAGLVLARRSRKVAPPSEERQLVPVALREGSTHG